MDNSSLIFIAISTLVIILIIGFVKININLKSKNGNKKFVDEYLEKLNNFVESGGNDLNSYDWLVEKSIKAQDDLGYLGIASAYKPAGAHYMFNNYQIIVNTLPELRQSLERKSQLFYELYMTIHETLVRYRGETNLSIEKISKNTRNPVIWFFHGIQFLLSIPFIILNWSGLVSSSLVSRVENNAIFKLISFIAGLIGFISSLITIFDEWELISKYYYQIISYFQ